MRIKLPMLLENVLRCARPSRLLPAHRLQACALHSPAAADVQEALPSLETPLQGEANLSGPLAAASDCLDTLHFSTGLPWWAAIGLAAAGVRLALLPLSIWQLRATAENLPLMQQALRSGLQRRKERVTPQGSGLSEWWASFTALRAEKQTSSLAWIVLAPTVQLPIFITAVMAVRRMAAMPWPGFSAGGTLWFEDLTLPALTLEPLSAPMSSPGVILPGLVAGLMLANLHQAFGRLDKGGSQKGSRGPLVLSYIRLGLEWLILPIFLTAMQLPQAVLVYWTASSSAAFLQAKALQSSVSRKSMGLPPLPLQLGALPTQSTLHPQSAAAREQQALDTDQTEISQLFARAAQARAEGNMPATLEVLNTIIAQDPRNISGWFALAQTFAGMQQWEQAGAAYLQVTQLAPELTMLARAYFGAGISKHRAGAGEAALELLSKAARTALPSNSPVSKGDRIGPVVNTNALIFTQGRLCRMAQEPRENSQWDPTLKEVAARALLSKSSILKTAGRTQESAETLSLAASFDTGAKQIQDATEKQSP